MQKHVNLVDLVKSFPTNIFLKNLASMQKTTILLKFAHLAEKSEKLSMSNTSKSRSRKRVSRKRSIGRAMLPSGFVSDPRAAAPEFGSFGNSTPPTGMIQKMNKERSFHDTR